jgi:hypothetical protein
MANKLSLILRSSLLQIVAAATLLVSVVLLALTFALSRIGTGALGISHPLGRLRAAAPLPAAPAPSAGSGQLDQMHVLLHEAGASRDGSRSLGASVD